MTNEAQEHKDIRQESHTAGMSSLVSQAIAGGKVRMQPRWYFVLRSVLLFCAALFAVFAMLYVVSLGVFLLRESGVLFVPAFGFRGIFELLAALPWVLVALGIVFLLGLELLVRRYGFRYRQPVLYTVLGVLLVAGVGSVVIDQFGLHRSLYERARVHRLPGAEQLYRASSLERSKLVVVGRVSEPEAYGFTLSERDGMPIAVMFTETTSFPDGRDFEEGDVVVVFGPRGTSTIQAFGVRELGRKGMVPPPLQAMDLQ